MNVDIIIPSYKKLPDIQTQYDNILATRKSTGNLIFTGLPASAAANRNAGLVKASTDIVIMLDDDMDGFYPDWDTQLIAPLLTDPTLKILSARLLKPDGTLGHTCSDNYDVTVPIVYLKNRRVPTACIAFYNDGLRFDEGYVGSGFEDSDFCYQIIQKYPEGSAAINNGCRLIHINEAKNQTPHWNTNWSYFRRKWGTVGNIWLTS